MIVGLLFKLASAERLAVRRVSNEASLQASLSSEV